MARKTYNNGDEISLTENGCDGCSPMMIQGVFCHETGCPDAWKDQKVECDWCGQSIFAPRWGKVFCDEECAQAYYG